MIEFDKPSFKAGEYSKTSKIHALIHEKEVVKQLCKWENAYTGLLFPSGMSAIMALMTLLRKNDKPRLIIIGLLYSETYSLLMDFWKGKFHNVYWKRESNQPMSRVLNLLNSMEPI